MKPVLAALFAVTVCGISRAGPAEVALLAAMRLSDQPNYTWMTVVADDAGTYNIEGRTERSGWTRVRLPMIRSVARRLGRQAEIDLDAVFKGTTSFVLHTDNGWQTWDELPRPSFWVLDDDDPLTGPANNGGYWSPSGGISGFDPTDPFFLTNQPPPRRTNSRRPYSNAQLGISPPHSELAVIVSSGTDIKVQGNIVTGNLRDIGAQLLLVRDGQEHIEPLAAEGTFKLLVKDGFVVKYLLQLQGVILIDGKSRVLVHQISATTVMNIGRTVVDIPDAARKKLDPRRTSAAQVAAR